MADEKVILREKKNLTLLESTYTKGFQRAKRELLVSWCACVIGTAVALSLGAGIKDMRQLASIALSAGSIAFVFEVLIKR